MYSKTQQSKGGVNAQSFIAQCPRCGDIGHGQRMRHHMKICDGSGFKNYWSKKKSEELKAQMKDLNLF